MLLFLLYAKLHLEKEKKIFIALLSISFKGSKLIKGKKKGEKKNQETINLYYICFAVNVFFFNFLFMKNIYFSILQYFFHCKI